jgi:hypothetical protein
MLFFTRELDFEEPLNGSRDPKLKRRPFDQVLGDVTELRIRFVRQGI